LDEILKELFSSQKSNLQQNFITPNQIFVRVIFLKPAFLCLLSKEITIGHFFD
jgi:hypothetical protein